VLETSTAVIIRRISCRLQRVLVMCTAMAAEACGVGEKNRLHGGTWEPEGGPAFIPVSNSVAISRLPQQPSQRIANRSYEEYAYVKNYFFVSLFGKCNRIKRFLGRLL